MRTNTVIVPVLSHSTSIAILLGSLTVSQGGLVPDTHIAEHNPLQPSVIKECIQHISKKIFPD